MLGRIRLFHLDIFSQVALRADKDERRGGGVSPDLWDPLLRNVLEGGGANHAEAQQEHIGAGVTERPQLVELILERRGGGGGRNEY